MTRETRLNLIVLAIILAVLTPGGVMLFRKKLQPTVKPMFMPHAVQREVAYLSPLDTPPGKRRVEPPVTARWVEAIVRERIGATTDGRTILRPTDRDGLPLASYKRTFQIVAAEQFEGQLRLWVMTWDREPLKNERWSVRVDGVERPIEVVESRAMLIPPMVREELGETGVTLPPHEAKWLEWRVAAAAGESLEVRRGSQDFVNFVPSFTNSGATRH